MIRKKFIQIISTALLLALPLTAVAQVDPNFTPNKLIEDKVFTDTSTFGGAAGIQKFLESKGSVLANTTADFISRLKEPSIVTLKQGLEDPGAALGRSRTAAELIWDAAQAAGINPQVILVTLQKEQGLITNHQNSSYDQLQKALDRSLGFDCPDASGCGNLFPGFYYQLFGNFDAENNRYIGAPKSLMKSFNTPNGRGPFFNGGPARVGDTLEIFNTQGPPNNAAPSQSVTLSNLATAALYRYTPHVFNGNYNFWKFMNQWFRYANGTLIKINGDNKLYIIQNGTRQIVPNFVAQARGLNVASTITLSPTEVETYPQDKVYGPADSTVVKATDSGKLFVFISNVKHPASEFVLGQRGLNPAQAISVAPEEINMFDSGSTLTPSDGTVLKGQTGTGIYLAQNNTLKLYSGFVWGQQGKGKKIQIIPDGEIDSYTKAGFVAPLDGTLVKAPTDLTVFLVDQGLKRPMTAEIFRNRKFSLKNIVTLSADEVNALALGSFAFPAEKTWFKSAQTGALYYFKDGTKHSISSFVAKQRKISSDYTFSQGEIVSWPDGIALPPKDGTLVRGDKDLTAFLVSAGQLKGLTAAAFKNRKYNIKNIQVLPQAEVDSYAKGDVLLK